ncbi:hypothetical protein HYALB_00003322, partial [Hymenoscyphus albidus]
SVSYLPVPLLVLIASALFVRVFYNLYLHPLSKFHGPWYAATTSLVCAFISVAKREDEWLQSLVRKYGSNFIVPLSKLYDTLDGAEHKEMRKTLSGAKVPWAIGLLKKEWESKIDSHIELFASKMQELVTTQETFCLSDRAAEFAADIMALVTFSTPWGFVQNSRDQYGILTSWRHGLTWFGFSNRWRFLRETIVHHWLLGPYTQPSVDDGGGMGHLMRLADEQLRAREKAIEDFGEKEGQMDYLQHAIEAKYHNEPLTYTQKHAHATFLIMAGADTTATALGATLRFLAVNPHVLSKAVDEISSAEKSGLLSAPIQYEESSQHLPYIGACIKESMRLHPPAPNIYERTVPKGGYTIDGTFVPGGCDVACVSYITHRDPDMYAPDPEVYRPERWLVSKEISNQFDSVAFAFGIGYRVCLGKDVATLELWKLIPEFVRRFEMELVEEGSYIVDGGVAYNQGFLVKLRARQ